MNSSIVSAATHYCSNCSDCSTKIQNANPGDTIVLQNNISDHYGNCIDFNGTDEIIFDCEGNLIDAQSYLDYTRAIDIEDSSYITIQNCKINNFFSGIGSDTSSYNVSLKDIYINDSEDGIHMMSGTKHYIHMENIKVTNCKGQGLQTNYLNQSIVNNISVSGCTAAMDFFGSFNSSFSDLKAVNNGNGIRIEGIYGEYNVFSDIVCINNSGYGFELSGDENVVYDSIFENNGQGIYVYGGYYSKVYNCIFNNSENVAFSVCAPLYTNDWNLIEGSGPNIIGGPNLGGNYWATPLGDGYSQICNNADNDSFCDTPYDVVNDTEGCDSNNCDYLPLADHNGTLGPQTYYCSNCSDCTYIINNVANPGDTVILQNDIMNPSEIVCIDFDGKENITFDCNNHKIEDTTSSLGTGFDLFEVNDSSINNCVIVSSDLNYPIYLSGSNRNSISNFESYSPSVIPLYLTSTYNNFTNVYLNQTYFDIRSTSENNVFSNVTLINTPSGYESFHIQASNNEFYDIVLSNGEYSGIGIFGGNNNIFDNVIIQYFEEYGIFVTDGDNNIFTNMNVNNNGWTGLRFWDANTGSDNNIVNESSFCYNVQEDISGDYDLFDQGINNSFNQITCDTSDPTGLCDNVCSVVIYCSNCSDCSTKIQNANPGDTVMLQNDIYDDDGNCIEILSKENIIFDCQGYLIDGDGDDVGFGINVASGSNNSFVKNCNVKDFTIGIRAGGYYNNFENINVYDNLEKGFRLHGANYNNLTNINAYSNGEDGIYFWMTNNTILRNINVTNNNVQGIGIEWYSFNNTLVDVNVSENNYGIGFYLSDLNNLTNITSSNNNLSGVILGSDSNNNRFFNSRLCYNNQTGGSYDIEDYDSNIFNEVTCDTSDPNGLCDYSCTVEESLCGNNLIDSGEECDDGNNQDGDGCSSTCQVEEGWYCDGDGCYKRPLDYDLEFRSKYLNIFKSVF